VPVNVGDSGNEGDGVVKGWGYRGVHGGGVSERCCVVQRAVSPVSMI
jgi:hypothetical protein